MNYAEAKAKRDALEVVFRETSAALGKFPSGNRGLTPDAVKATPEYQAAKTAFNRAFDDLRKFNAEFVRQYAREIRAERWRGRWVPYRRRRHDSSTR